MNKQFWARLWLANLLFFLVAGLIAAVYHDAGLQGVGIFVGVVTTVALTVWAFICLAAI